MMSFIIGAALSAAVFFLLYRRASKRSRATLIDIHDGYAIPDEYGNVGWVRNPERQAAMPAPTHPLIAALITAVDHIEHMAKYITDRAPGYSFESLGEDLPGMREAVRQSKATLEISEADAFELVSRWHYKQADTFGKMSKDVPRTGELERAKAAEAAKHHAASGAALQLRAMDLRQKHYKNQESNLGK
jgi:hypothetical protein